MSVVEVVDGEYRLAVARPDERALGARDSASCGVERDIGFDIQSDDHPMGTPRSLFGRGEGAEPP